MTQVQLQTPPVGVAVSIVVAEQVVLPHYLVPGDFEGLVHRGEQVLTQTGNLDEKAQKNSVHDHKTCPVQMIQHSYCYNI